MVQELKRYEYSYITNGEKYYVFEESPQINSIQMELAVLDTFCHFESCLLRMHHKLFFYDRFLGCFINFKDISMYVTTSVSGEMEDSIQKYMTHCIYSSIRVTVVHRHKLAISMN